MIDFLRLVGYWMIAAGVVGLFLGAFLHRRARPVADFERWEAELPVHSRRLYDWAERPEL